MNKKIWLILIIILFVLCIVAAINTGKRANKEMTRPKPELISQIDFVSNSLEV